MTRQVGTATLQLPGLAIDPERSAEPGDRRRRPVGPKVPASAPERTGSMGFIAWIIAGAVIVIVVAGFVVGQRGRARG
jgi:hypothetical protein